MVVPGVLEHFLATGEPLGIFLLRARAHGMAGHAVGPCVLGQGHRIDTEEAVALRELRISARGRSLDAEAVEALRELHRPRLEVGKAVRGMVEGRPQRC